MFTVSEDRNEINSEKMTVIFHSHGGVGQKKNGMFFLFFFSFFSGILEVTSDLFGIFSFFSFFLDLASEQVNLLRNWMFYYLYLDY